MRRHIRTRTPNYSRRGTCNCRRLIDNCNKVGDDTDSTTASRLYAEVTNNSSCDERGRRLPGPCNKIDLDNRVKLTLNIRNANSVERLLLKISCLQCASPVIQSSVFT